MSISRSDVISGEISMHSKDDERRRQVYCIKDEWLPQLMIIGCRWPAHLLKTRRRAGEERSEISSSYPGKPTRFLHPTYGALARVDLMICQPASEASAASFGDSISVSVGLNSSATEPADGS